MGFDITFHPITKTEISSWYFDRLDEVAKDDFSVSNEMAEKQNFMELFNLYDKRAPIENLSEQEKEVLFSDKALYVEKYLNVLKSANNFSEEDIFEKSHGFSLAIVQGFFRTYYYVRNSSLSDFISMYPEFAKYKTSWQELFPMNKTFNAHNEIIENYSSGVYITHENILKLLESYNHEQDTKTKFDNFFTDGRINVLLEAMEACAKGGFDLLEATDVMVPTPLRLGEGICYSNIVNCDIKGLVLYHNAAMQEIAEIEKNRKPVKKNSFFSRLFGKK